MIYHVTWDFTLSEYYRVEADSEEEAKEKILDGMVEAYHWDQVSDQITVEPTRTTE